MAETLLDGEKSTELLKMEKLEITSRKSNRTFLYIATATVNLFAFASGVALGWSSPILPKLSSNIELNLPAGITTEDESWIGSLLALGAAVGPLPAGFFIDKLGRKKTLLLSGIPMLVAFIAFVLANNVFYYYVGRFLCGLTIGGVFTVLPVYVAEISEDEVRGALASFLQFFCVSGLTFAYATGPYISMTAFNLIGCVILLFGLTSFFLFIPETPQYLISQGDLKQAEQSLMKLRSRSREEIIAEFNEIKVSLQGSSDKQGGFSDMFASPAIRKALGLTFLLMLFQQFCGICVVLFYTAAIFEATGSSIPSDISTILIGVAQIIPSVVVPIVVDKFGKRFLLMTSAGMMCITETALGVYFYLKEHDHNVESISWLPIASLILYIVFYCFGMGPLPWAVMGELFPQEVKSVAATTIAASCWFMAFMMTKCFSTVADLIGMGGSFWFFASFCAIAVVQVYKFLPETSGKSLQEIQDILAGKKK